MPLYTDKNLVCFWPPYLVKYALGISKPYSIRHPRLYFYKFPHRRICSTGEIFWCWWKWLNCVSVPFCNRQRKEKGSPGSITTRSIVLALSAFYNKKASSSAIYGISYDLPTKPVIWLKIQRRHNPKFFFRSQNQKSIFHTLFCNSSCLYVFFQSQTKHQSHTWYICNMGQSW